MKHFFEFQFVMVKLIFCLYLFFRQLGLWCHFTDILWNWTFCFWLLFLFNFFYENKNLSGLGVKLEAGTLYVFHVPEEDFNKKLVGNGKIGVVSSLQGSQRERVDKYQVVITNFSKFCPDDLYRRPFISILRHIILIIQLNHTIILCHPRIRIIIIITIIHQHHCLYSRNVIKHLRQTRRPTWMWRQYYTFCL